MTDASLEHWLRSTLAARAEHIESIGPKVEGTRTVRRFIRTERRELVVKVFAHDDEFARRECDSYEVLLRSTADIVAPVVAIDRAARYVLLERLQGRDLFAALADTDPMAVLHELAGGIATMITGTQDSPGSLETAIGERDALVAKLPLIRDLFRAASIDLDDRAYDAMMALCDAATTPPLALTQGDPAPSNLLFTREGLRFVDFEYGAVRHALFDLAQWFIRIPLPLPWFETLSKRVRDRVVGAGVFATAADFDQALARMCQNAGLYMLTWLPVADAWKKDRPWVGDWTVRKALLSTLDRLARVAIGPHRTAFATLSSILLARWRDSSDFAIDWSRLIQSSRA